MEACFFFFSPRAELPRRWKRILYGDLPFISAAGAFFFFFSFPPFFPPVLISEFFLFEPGFEGGGRAIYSALKVIEISMDL